MANIKATVTSQGNNLKSKVNPQKSITVSEYKLNASVRLEDLINIDSTEISDGALLVYSSNTSNWKATTKIENPNTQVNGGHY